MPNLIFLRKTRPKFRSGDLFRMHHTAGGWLFGRIIEADLPPGCGPMPGSMLIYVYAGLRASDTPQPDWLNPHDLLIPPVFTNALAWRHGFYETIEHRPLTPADRLERHVFRNRRLSQRADLYYVDECRNEVDPPGDGRASRWGLWAYRAIDDDISAALGVDLAPPDEDD